MPTGIPMLSRAFKKSADKPITNNTANGLDPVSYTHLTLPTKA